MGDPVEQGSRHLGVAEDRAPFPELKVCREDQRCFLVQVADEL